MQGRCFSEKIAAIRWSAASRDTLPDFEPNSSGAALPRDFPGESSAFSSRACLALPIPHDSAEHTGHVFAKRPARAFTRDGRAVPGVQAAVGFGRARRLPIIGLEAVGRSAPLGRKMPPSAAARGSDMPGSRGLAAEAQRKGPQAPPWHLRPEYLPSVELGQGRPVGLRSGARGYSPRGTWSQPRWRPREHW